MHQRISACVVGATDLELRDQRVFVRYRLLAGQTCIDLETTKHVPDSYPCQRRHHGIQLPEALKNPTGECLCYSKQKQRRSIQRPPTHVGLTCDDDMRQNNAGIPEELKRCE